MIRQIFASEETGFMAAKAKGKFIKVYSLFPVDRADCDCQKMINDHKLKLARANDSQRMDIISATPFLVCPRDKSKLNRYSIICRNCGEIQGYCYAPNPNLKDWCDFHYVQYSKDGLWYGCLTPHISPIDQELRFECCCGNDTRDFRPNMTISEKQAEKIEKENSKGREFNKKDSKFIVNLLSKK